MSARFSRIAVVALCGVAWWLASCRDLPTPVSGVLSVSPVILPSPGVVVGDTMRDSTGIVAPLSLVAFDAAGNPVPNVPTTFFVLDTGAHLAGALLVADTSGDTVRVIGSVEAVQTLPALVKLTLSPDTLVATDSVVQRRTYSIAVGDTVANAELNTRVLHRVDSLSLSGVEAVIVRYLIERAPQGSTNSGPAVVLVEGSRLSARDTTDVNGQASRTARLRVNALIPPFATDTVVVSATASYKGLSIGRVVFTVVFVNQ